VRSNAQGIYIGEASTKKEIQSIKKRERNIVGMVWKYIRMRNESIPAILING